MLLRRKEHEMHHRGQLMTMQRMIGQVPHLTRQMQERMAQMQAAAQRSRRVDHMPTASPGSPPTRSSFCAR